MVGRAFRCPLCGSGGFRPIAVPRPGGNHYQTAFFECAGCSVMFIDPNSFNANEPGPPLSAGTKLPPTPLNLCLETYAKGATATMSEDSPADPTEPV